MSLLERLSNTTESLGNLAEAAKGIVCENLQLKEELAAIHIAMEELAKEKAAAVAEGEYWRIRYNTREASTLPVARVAARRKRA